MKPLTGNCACGEVQIAALGEPLRVGICHCSDCRKHHGALFYAAAIFSAKDVVIDGQTQAHEGRHFCPVCGSQVFARTGDEVEVHLGTLNHADHLVPTYECWTVRRAPWLQPVPGATQYERDREG